MGIGVHTDGASVVTGRFYEQVTFGYGEPNETTLVSETGNGFVAKYEGPTSKTLDIDGDGNAERAVDSDGNPANGYEQYVDPDGSSAAMVSVDVDGDGKTDHLIDTDGDGVADVYWDPDDGIVTSIVVTDVDGDGTDEWLIDTDGDGAQDTYYDPDSGTVVWEGGTFAWPLVAGFGEGVSGDSCGQQNDYQDYPCTTYTETGPDAVYSVTTEGEGTLEVTLTGLKVDLDLFLFNGPSADNCVAASTNAGVADERVSYAGPAGTYYMVVDGYGGMCGPYTLTAGWDEPPLTPTPTPPGSPTPTAVPANYIDLTLLPAEVKPGGTVGIGWTCDFTQWNYEGRPVNVYLAAIRNAKVADGPGSIEDALAGGEVWLFEEGMATAYRYAGATAAPSNEGAKPKRILPTWSGVAFPPVAFEGRLSFTTPPSDYFVGDWVFATAFLYEDGTPVRADLPVENSNITRLAQ
jgi:hypothetical protein